LSNLEQQHKRAIAALNTGDFPMMVSLCRKILEQDSEYADAWFLLSIAAEAAENPSKAIAFVDKAIILQGDSSEYLAQKARYHILLNQEDAAAEAVSRALALEPEVGLTLDTLGVVLTRLDDHCAALDCYQAAVKYQPKNPQYHFNLASAQQFLGEQGRARQHYEEAIFLKPKFARAYWALSELQKNSVDDKYLNAMQIEASNPAIGADNALYFGHAIARVLESRGDFAEAFQYLVTAKKAKQLKVKNVAADFKALFSAVHDAFPSCEGNILHKPTSNRNGPGPLFIVGMPRSGTTLVERILTSHSRIISLGESQALPRAVHQASKVKSEETLSPDVMAGAQNLKEGEIRQFYHRALLRQLNKYPGPKAWHIDKLPLNFFHLGLINRTLPDAKMICVRRNPLDTILSNYRQLFALDFTYYNYSYSLEDTAHYYVCFHRLMEHWKISLGERVLEINYDQLVLEPEPIIRTTLDYLNLEWEPSCLKFHQNLDAATSASATQVRQPLYQDALGRWKYYRNELRPAIEILDEAGITYT